MDIDYSRWIAPFQCYRPAPNQGDLLLVTELVDEIPNHVASSDSPQHPSCSRTGYTQIYIQYDGSLPPG